jgi:hypothetical protein
MTQGEAVMADKNPTLGPFEIARTSANLRLASPIIRDIWKSRNGTVRSRLAPPPSSSRRTVKAPS